MKHNYVIICLDSMFETFLVADEFEFLRFWDVFDVSLPQGFFGTEISNTSLIRKNSNSSATKKVSNIESKQIMT